MRELPFLSQSAILVTLEICFCNLTEGKWGLYRQSERHDAYEGACY